MPDIFSLLFIKRAFLASVLVGILLPPLGSFAILRKNAFLGAGIAHIAFAGVAFGLFVNHPPIAWGFMFTWLATGFIWIEMRRGAVDYELGMGIFFSLSMAVALFLLGISKSFKSEAFAYLFGSVITTTWSDVYILSGVTFLTILILSLFYKEFFYITFHEELAMASGINVDFFLGLLLFLTASAVVASLKAVGALLVFGLLIMPAAASYQLTFKFDKMLYLSIVFGLISSIGGLFSSLLLDIPSGSSIVVFAFIIFVLARFFSIKTR